MIIRQLLISFIVATAFCHPLRSHDGEALDIKLLQPTTPFSVQFLSPETFIFRADLINKDQEIVKIYLARGTRESDNQDGKHKYLKVLSKLKLHSGVSNYMVIWTPKPEDKIPEDGGSDFYLAVRKPSWWGWREVTVFESEYFSISPLHKSTLIIQ